MGRPRKPQVVWMPEQDGYLWYQYASYSRKGAVELWVSETGRDWKQWRQDRPTLRVVKVQLVPLEAPRGK